MMARFEAAATNRADCPATDGKSPLILLPGSLCDASMWAAQVAALSDFATTQVVVWNGHDDVREAARDALASTPFERFSLIGFSLGGYVALQMIQSSPHRILRLALLSTSARPDDPSRVPSREANIAAFEKGASDVVDRFIHVTLGPRTSAQTADAIRTMMHRNSFDYAQQQRAIMTRPDARAGLADIVCPTLILCGSDDAATPPALHREMAKTIQHSRYAEVSGAAHMTPMEAPEVVNDELRSWLTNSSS